MAKKIGDKYFLEPGDLVTVSSGTLEFTGGDYKVADLSDASLRFWIDEDEADYEIRYAIDLPQGDPNYGKPYFSRENKKEHHDKRKEKNV